MIIGFLFVDSTIGGHSGMMSGTAWRGYELQDGSLISADVERRSERVRTVDVMRRVRYASQLGLHEVSIEYWVGYQNAVPPDWSTPNMPLEEVLAIKPEWGSLIRNGISRNSLDLHRGIPSQSHDPAQAMLDELIASGRSGTLRQSNLAARVYQASSRPLRLGLFTGIVLTFVLAVARRWFEGMVIARRKRLSADLCPSCSYPQPGVTCPECGIDADAECTLVTALNDRGYRGLKALSS